MSADEDPALECTDACGSAELLLAALLDAPSR